MKNKKAKLWVVLLALGSMLVYAMLGNAGSLEPSGPPASTMKTLEEVEPRVPVRSSDLPLVITEAKSYYFAEDIGFEPNDTDAITVECNDVTIDLMGYTLEGPGSGIKSGINMNGCSNVEICNGTIRDFGNYAISENSSSGKNHRIINVRLLSNGYGICLGGSGHLVKNCAASGNINYGIIAGGNTTLTGNTFCDNGNWGVSTSDGCILAGNTCCDNSGDGIITGDVCTITCNTTMDNGAKGINAGDYCLIDQNTAYSNTGGNLSYGTGSVLGTNCAP